MGLRKGMVGLDRRANEGRLILARKSPSMNMTWTRRGTTKCRLRREVESTGRNFSHIAASFARRLKEADDGGPACVLLWTRRA